MISFIQGRFWKSQSRDDRINTSSTGMPVEEKKKSFRANKFKLRINLKRQEAVHSNIEGELPSTSSQAPMLLDASRLSSVDEMQHLSLFTPTNKPTTPKPRTKFVSKASIFIPTNNPTTPKARTRFLSKTSNYKISEYPDCVL